MNKHDFILRFTLPDPTSNPADFTEALFKAGCDDAVVGVGNPGAIAFDFCREAPTAELAVRSAVDAVLSAIPGAKLTDVTPTVESSSSLLIGVSD